MLLRTVRDMGGEGDTTVYDLLGTSKGLAGWMSLLQLIMLFLFVVSIYRFLRRRRSTAKAIIAVASVQIVWFVLMLMEFSRAMGDTGADVGLKRMWPMIAMAALIIAYFVRSKRVKETFVT